MTNYEKLRAKLIEIFQLDRSDLDFGIYRILNSKRDEIVQFLEQDLLPQVKEILVQAHGEIGGVGAEELKQAEHQARSLDVDPDTIPKVRELRAKIAQASGHIEALEQAVFNHLYNFFRRYYDEGDFISLRRYKEGVYAIPYEGEEVKLHWANADQYYIKTAEHFRDYTFKVGEKRVHFKLVDAQTERDNNKETEKRVFILAEETPVFEENGELTIRFEYRNDPVKSKQKDLQQVQATWILANAPVAWQPILKSKAPTEKAPDRTILAKHLAGYTARNTFDYFIHKDLGEFLRRELDFYIKNEVMHLDDVENEDAPKVEQYLAKVRAIRRVASKLIDFLAQLEDFQKRLWLKKKFVVDTQYLVTLDRVPEDLYPEIAANDAQREEWVRLFAIDDIKGDLLQRGYSIPLSVDFLAKNPQLIVNTTHYSKEFCITLMAADQANLPSPDGVLFAAENLQALNLLSFRYRNVADSIYIDPPYNTDASEIIYKNNYKHASWLSLLSDRLVRSKSILKPDGIICVTIDDAECSNLRIIANDLFGPENALGVACIRNNPQGRSTVKGFAVNHEYGLFYRNSPQVKTVGRIERTQEQIDRYIEEDEDGKFLWENFRKTGTDSNRVDRPKQFYPIFSSDRRLRVPEMTWDAVAKAWDLKEDPRSDETVFWPLNEIGVEKVWKWGHERVTDNPSDVKVGLGQDGCPQVFRRNRLSTTGALPGTWWDKAEYGAGSHGTNLLTAMFGVGHTFPFPKSVFAVAACLQVSGLSAEETVLDYFAGSGTTAHAVLKLNRQDQGNRRFLLVEMGTHFDRILVPRLCKAIYSDLWKDGKPIDRQSGISQTLKIVRLESYEDTLSNIFVSRALGQETLLTDYQHVREDYFLRYVLSAETVESPSLLNVQAFSHPFAYKLNVATDTVGETKEVNVDLIETFNWLLGLRVHTMDVIRGFHIVTGRLPGPGNSEDGEKALVIWRDTTENPSDKLDDFFRKQNYNTLDQEFDVIYVNGDNNLQNLRKDDQTWKVRLIDEEFHRLMWDVEDV